MANLIYKTEYDVSNSDDSIRYAFIDVDGNLSVLDSESNILAGQQIDLLNDINQSISEIESNNTVNNTVNNYTVNNTSNILCITQDEIDNMDSNIINKCITNDYIISECKPIDYSRNTYKSGKITGIKYIVSPSSNINLTGKFTFRKSSSPYVDSINCETIKNEFVNIQKDVDSETVDISDRYSTIPDKYLNKNGYKSYVR